MTPAEKDTRDKTQEAQRLSRERYEKDIKSAFQDMLLNQQTRLVLWWLIERCGLYQTGPIGNAGTAVHQGQRNIGLQIVSMIESIQPGAYYEMCAKASREFHDKYGPQDIKTEKVS